jgi:hypothetical protein
MPEASTLEIDLVEVLKNTQPGAQLDMTGIPPEDIQRAVEKMSAVGPLAMESAEGFSLGDHVWPRTYWARHSRPCPRRQGSTVSGHVFSLDFFYRVVAGDAWLLSRCR